MRTLTTWARLTSAVVALAGFAACSDAPNAPVTTEPAALAASFDAMAQEDAMAGDAELAAEWRWAASMLRIGMVPSKIEIRTNGKVEEYDAFVRGVEEGVPQAEVAREPGHIMLAWQRLENNRINHVMRLWSPGDYGTIIPREVEPMQLLPGAHFDYREVGGLPIGTWRGVEGAAQVREGKVGANCQNVPAPEFGWQPPKRVLCQKTYYHVSFEVLVRLERPEPQVQFEVWMVPQKVGGVKLTPTY